MIKINSYYKVLKEKSQEPKAKLKKMSEDDLEEAITQNAHTFFRL